MTVQWIDQAEANALVRNTIAQSTWEKLRHRREVTYTRVGKQVLYDRASVLQYLDRKAVRAERPHVTTLRYGRAS